ncbi:MAG TPA: hypothetical protein VM184_06650 [Gaiellaceae bacterium]|nr:hypothetical protein [Gaiellaceae bacterium]
MFFWWQALVAGFVATVVMAALMRMGASMGMTRMDMMVMLGSMFRRDEAGARRLGTPIHFMNGLVFGLVYGVAWWALGPDPANAWWIGLVFGAVHAVVAMAMMPVMSSMHPRVRERAGQVEGGPVAGDVALPPFGFGGTGFGSMTPVGILMGHLVFGLVWGLVLAWLV